MGDTSLLLSELSFKEFLKGKLQWEIGPIKFGDFNLIVGDNAQGKTRLFNILSRLKNIITTGSFVNNSELKVEYRLLFIEKENDLTENKITYDLAISVNRTSGQPDYVEVIWKNGGVLFDRSKSLLHNEAKDENIPNFFLQPNSPVILAVRQDDFPTFQKIRSFFERALFLEGNHFISNQVDMSTASSQSMFVNSTGSNIASVVLNWKDRIPLAFDELKKEFTDCFSIIDDKSFNVKMTALPGMAMPTPILTFREKSVEKDVLQIEWSDGMLRSMCLFALPLSRFVNADGSFLRPSMICIDEVENGLDYKTAKHLISLFKSYCNMMQIMLISHSPTICNMIPTQDWRITKRNGSKVSFFTPDETESNIDDIRLNLHQDNWEFYKRHISKSPLYSVK